MKLRMMSFCAAVTAVLLLIACGQEVAPSQMIVGKWYADMMGEVRGWNSVRMTATLTRVE